jgi:hypothetical protein
LWGELADLEQVEAERLDLSQYAVECRPIQQAGEHGVCAVVLRHQRWERGEHSGAEVAVDPDRIQDGCWVHEAIVERWQVNPHHQDLVTAGLTGQARRQEPQLSRALYRRGAITGLELGVDVADVGVDCVHRDG